MRRLSNFFVSILFVSFSSQVLAEPLRVGMIVPLSGYVAEYGESVRDSITLLQSEMNEDRTAQIQLIYEDSEYEGKKSLSAFHKLTKTNKIDLLYVWGTTPSVVLAPIAESARITMIGFSGDSAVAGGRKYVIDSVNRLEEYSIHMLEHLRSKGHKNIGIVKTEVQYLESLVNGMEKNLKEDETIHLIDSFTPDVSADVKTSALKVRTGISRGSYDVLGVLLVPGHISSFYQRLAQLNVNVLSFGSDFFSNKEEMNKAGSASVGAFFVQPSVSRDFSEKFIARFNKANHVSYAYLSYSVFKVLYDLFPTGSENLTAEEIISRIEEKSPKKESGSAFYFTRDDPTKYPNPGRRFESEFVIRTIKEDGSH